MRDPRVEQFLEEVWRDTEFGESVRTLKDNLDMADDVEFYLFRFRAATKSMLRDKKCDVSTYATEQRLKGNLAYQRMQAAAHEMKMAAEELKTFHDVHKRGAK